MKIKSLADFRRFLAQPGATIQVIRHDWASTPITSNTCVAATLNARPGFWEPRTVAKLQTNAVKFSNDSWLDWRNGAKGFRFDGGDVVTVDLKHDGSFSEIMQYKCTLQSS